MRTYSIYAQLSRLKADNLSQLCRNHNRSPRRFSTAYTDSLSFLSNADQPRIPVYRILGDEARSSEVRARIGDQTLVDMYKSMLSLSVMDTVMYESQRQGRISFYMTNYGEEAVQIGSAAALVNDDLIYAQYRESGVLLWRGFGHQDFVNQCFGNKHDRGKGRQMPIHYGSKAHNFVTLSSPLGTQLPQAAGAAYGFKILKKKACVACYFGEGAASEGDAHAAFNFAATLDCPLLLVCRNNGYAISTPSSQQYRGDGIAARGPAYGISTVRVDGNDILAVFDVTQAARDYALENNKPVLIEAMTYRIGHHSTSDDSSAYRSNQEVQAYANSSPIVRLRTYLEKLGLWSREQEDKCVSDNKKLIKNALAVAEKNVKPDVQEFFTDVYSTMPYHIRRQKKQLEDHVRRQSESRAAV